MDDHFCRIGFDEAANIAYYQMDILRNRNDGRFTDIIAGTSCNGITVSFTTDGLMSIERFYSTRPLDRNNAINIIKKVADNAAWCMTNLLDPACMLAQPQNIYMIPNRSEDLSADIRMIYSPVRKPENEDHPAPLSSDFISFLELASPHSLFSADEISMIRNLDLYFPEECLRVLSSLNDDYKNEVTHCKFKDELIHVFSVISYPLFIVAQLLLIYAAFHLLRNIDSYTSPIIVLLIVVFMILLLAGADVFVFLNRTSPFRKYFGELLHSGKDLKKPSISNSSEEKTVLIDINNGNSRIAMLCSGIPGTPEESKAHKGFILADDFLVGRDASKVDFVVSGSSVGRIHARITRRQNSFFIEDLGSHNGTCIDGHRIKKGTDNPLPDKCRISFADKEYYFVVS